MKIFLSRGFLDKADEIEEDANCFGIVHVEKINRMVPHSENYSRISLDINDGETSTMAILDELLWNNLTDTPTDSQQLPLEKNDLHKGSVIVIQAYKMISMKELTNNESSDEALQFMLITKYCSIGYIKAIESSNTIDSAAAITSTTTLTKDTTAAATTKDTTAATTTTTIDNAAATTIDTTSTTTIDTAAAAAVTTATSTNNSGEYVMPRIESKEKKANILLNAIMPNKHKWIVEVVVLKVGDIRPLTTKAGNLQRFRIRDSSASTEMVVFNEQMEKLGVQEIRAGRVYRIENGIMRVAHEKYRQWPNEFALYYDLHCNSTTSISELTALKPSDILGFEDQEPTTSTATTTTTTNSEISCMTSRMKRLPSISSNLSYEVKKMRDSGDGLHLTSLGTLDSHPVGTHHNILAVIVSIAECKATNPKNRATKMSIDPLMCRNVRVVDRSRRQVDVAFWGNEAEYMDLECMRVGTVLLITKVKLKNFNGVCLSKERDSKLSVFNDTPINDSYLSKEIQSLMAFWQNYSNKK